MFEAAVKFEELGEERRKREMGSWGGFDWIRRIEHYLGGGEKKID